MPDTGFMSPDNVVANANTFFNTAWLVEASGIIVFLATTGTQTVDGFENDGTLPAGATITGAEVLLTNTYVTSGTGTFDIQISINGGSSFSDLSQLQVKGLNGVNNIYSQHVQIKLYYTETVHTPTLNIKSGEVIIKGGKLTIK